MGSFRKIVGKKGAPAAADKVCLPGIKKWLKTRVAKARVVGTRGRVSGTAAMALSGLVKRMCVEMLARTKLGDVGEWRAIAKHAGRLVLPKTCVTPRARVKRVMRGEAGHGIRFSKEAIALVHRVTEGLVARQLHDASLLLVNGRKTLGPKQFQVAGVIGKSPLSKFSK